MRNVRMARNRSERLWVSLCAMPGPAFQAGLYSTKLEVLQAETQARPPTKQLLDNGTGDPVRGPLHPWPPFLDLPQDVHPTAKEPAGLHGFLGCPPLQESIVAGLRLPSKILDHDHSRYLNSPNSSAVSYRACSAVP